MGIQVSNLGALASAARHRVSITVPGAPTTVTAIAGAGQATVSFSAPVSNGGSAIIDYTVTSSPGGFTGTTTNSPVIIMGLTNGIAYTFTAKARNAVGSSAASAPSIPVTPGGGGTLSDPHAKDIAMQLVSSNENSSLDWRAQYSYIEDIGDGRGYTGGIVGFCSGTGDMLELVQYYTQTTPGNILAKYVSALIAVNGSASHTGLDPNYVADWQTAAGTAAFQAAQDHERDRVYFDPAVSQALADGLHVLGQFIYYDALVMHGPGSDPVSFGGIRATALSAAQTPAQGGNETTYLNAFLDARKAAMLTEAAHDDTSRVDTEQRVFLDAGNLNLVPPLTWHTYGDLYTIAQ